MRTEYMFAIWSYNRINGEISLEKNISRVERKTIVTQIYF